eukprot:m.203502 g.203502  ORF g.203502 m.203502 type:complete len:425 (+) comp39625_c1_seq21:92-1366(+)
MSEKMASEHMQKKKSCAHDLAEEIRRAKCFGSCYKYSEIPEKVIEVVCFSSILPSLLRGALGLDPSFLETREKSDNDFKRRQNIIQLWIEKSVEKATLEILFDAVERGGQLGTVSASLKATLRSAGPEPAAADHVDGADASFAHQPQTSDRRSSEESTASDAVAEVQNEANYEKDGHGGLVDVAHFGAMDKVGNTVCLITGTRNPDGTGFLIGKDVVVTCSHVIPDSQEFPDPEDSLDGVKFVFNYKAKGEKDPFKIDGQEYEGSKVLWRNASEDLDFVLVRLTKKVTLPEGSSYRKLEVYGNAKTTAETFYDMGRRLTIIQHPLGGVQKASVLQKLYRRTDPKNDVKWILAHKMATEKGSSGSPMVDEKGTLVGIHGRTTKGIKKAKEDENHGVFVNDIVKNIPKVRYGKCTLFTLNSYHKRW